MRRVRYASTNDIRYTGYGRRSSGSSGGGVSALREGVSDLEAGVSQSWKNAQARRDRAFDKRFNDEWNRYRSAGWKR